MSSYSLDITLDVATLGRFYPLNTLSAEDLGQLISQARYEHYRQGESLFRAGSTDDSVLFLVSGRLHLSGVNGDEQELDAQSPQARYPVANIKPRQYSARVSSETAAIVRLPGALLERMMCVGQIPPLAMAPPQAGAKLNAVDSEWTMAMMRTPLFRRLPAEHIEALVGRMDEVYFKSGDQIVKQGERGDYFYLVKHGRCRVTRFNGKLDVKLADIGPTHAFGEEALLTDAPRNASVTALSDCTVMRLSKIDFGQLVLRPVVRWVDPRRARMLRHHGAVIIDVGEAPLDEAKDCIHLPLYLLRTQMRKFSRKQRYLLRSNDRSAAAAAAFLMTLRGLETYVLREDLASAA